MINFDDYTKENNIKYNLKWPYIPDHPYSILMHIKSVVFVTIGTF